MTSFSRSISETALTDNPPSDALTRAYGANRKISNITLYEDFSEYHNQQAYADANWVTTNTTNWRVDVVNDRFTTTNGATSLTSAYYDLGSTISNSAWNLRFRYRLSQLTSSAASDYIMIGISSTNGTPNANQFSIHIRIEYDNGFKGYAVMGSNTQTQFGGSSGNSVNLTWALSTDYFIELKRTSTTTCTVEVFSDSSYTTSLGLSSLTISSAIQSLRYIKTSNVTGSGGQSSGGFIDEIQLTDAQSTPSFTLVDTIIRTYGSIRSPSETALTDNPPSDSIVRAEVAGRGISETILTTNPPTDALTRIYGANRRINEGVTFYEDFSEYHNQQAYADANWVTSFTNNFRVDVTNDRLTTVNTTTSLTWAYYDLGSTISNSLWNLRFRFRLAQQQSGGASQTYFIVGISSTNGTPNANQFSIHMKIENDSAVGKGYMVLGSNNQTQISGSPGNFITLAWAISTDYFIEIKRTSTTTCTVEVFSDSGYTVSLGLSSLTINSAIQNLRYIKVGNVNGSGVQIFSGFIDEIQFTNGSSTPLISLTDTISRSYAATRNPNETILTTNPPSDTLTRATVQGRNISEPSYTSNDTLSRTFAAIRSMTEPTITITDFLVNYFRRTISRIVRILR